MQSTKLLPFDATTLAPLCTELDAWRKSLDSEGPFLRSWQGRLRRDLEAEAVAASTSMEGVPVTVDEVRRILIGERPSEVSESDRRLVEGYRDAMGFVLRRADDSAFRWDRELWVGLHDRILAGDWAAGAGRFRTATRRVANTITGRVVYEPPDSNEVPDLVDRVCAVMTAGLGHPALEAAWVHVAAAAIHPFADGNGRAARVLASLAMYRGSFLRREFTSLEEWWGRHLPAYYAAFDCLGPRFDRGAEVTPFMLAHLEAQVSQVRALDLRERVMRRIFLAILQLLEDAALGYRLSDALWDAFLGRDVTAGYYRSVAGISPATATNDLVRAGATGLLRAEGDNRGRKYVAGPQLYRAIAERLGIDLEPTAERLQAAIVSELSATVAQHQLDRAALSRVDPPGLGE